MKIEDKKIDEYIKKISVSNCPLCGNNNWTITDRVLQLTEFRTENVEGTNTLFPVIPLTCQNCGNTYFINVLVAGLIDKPNQKENTANENTEKD